MEGEGFVYVGITLVGACAIGALQYGISDAEHEAELIAADQATVNKFHRAYPKFKEDVLGDSRPEEFIVFGGRKFYLTVDGHRLTDLVAPSGEGDVRLFVYPSKPPFREESSRSYESRPFRGEYAYAEVGGRTVEGIFPKTDMRPERRDF